MFSADRAAHRIRPDRLRILSEDTGVCGDCAAEPAAPIPCRADRGQRRRRPPAGQSGRQLDRQPCPEGLRIPRYQQYLTRRCPPGSAARRTSAATSTIRSVSASSTTTRLGSPAAATAANTCAARPRTHRPATHGAGRARETSTANRVFPVPLGPASTASGSASWSTHPGHQLADLRTAPLDRGDRQLRGEQAAHRVPVGCTRRRLAVVDPHRRGAGEPPPDFRSTASVRRNGSRGVSPPPPPGSHALDGV